MPATATRKRSPQFIRRHWQRLQDLPLPEPEDSIPLRVLVQLLVSVGIIATDVASLDVANWSGLSLWAVPLSIVGATWSYYRRRSRNVPVKFCIAIAMLVALAVFFVQLLSEPNDTRLALAELLIQLQVFHSFDLPRRKDLGYSMIIGLILIGVGGTLSQTLAFAPLLLLFLAIALPALILDYRSRLGLQPSRSFRRVGIDLSLKRLSLFLLVTVALGLTIFAFLPRLPGYQLRTFPVSSLIEFDGEFDSTAIINPGYVRGGRNGEATGGGTGNGTGRGAGEVDDTLYYGFNSQINQNLRGQLEPQVVMRVRSQAEGFWRVLAFDHYTGQGWEISRNDESQIETLDRPGWSLQFLLPWSVAPWLSVNSRTREVIQTYTIISDLTNLIPALHEPRQIYFPTEELAIDAEGGLRSPVQLVEGVTYTVISEVPYRDRTLLQAASTDYPRTIRDYYLEVPEAIADRVRQRTEEILATAPNPITAPSEQALYLAQYLKQNYILQLELPFLEEDEDLVEAFLFRYQGGYPDHFSTVLTVMLRSIGIPARLAAGFRPGEYNPFTGFYVVRNTDAYAITEVLFPGYGWFAFDPIPGHEVVPPSVEDNQVFSVLRQFWNWVAGWLPSPVSGFLNQLFGWVAISLGWLFRWVASFFARGWVGLLLGLAVLTGLSFLGWLSWQGWRSLRYRYWLSNLPPMEAIYQQMLRGLASQGFRKPSAQTPLEYARQVQAHHAASRAAAIEEISRAYVRWRYGGRSPNLTRLRQQLKELTRKQPKRKH
jgi:transglutaminase-like putative cysteine protease